MSAETDELLDGLYNYDEDDGGPYINWTNGFEATDDEYDEYQGQPDDNA